jgi:hypothetical protein
MLGYIGMKQFYLVVLVSMHSQIDASDGKSAVANRSPASTQQQTFSSATINLQGPSTHTYHAPSTHHYTFNSGPSLSDLGIKGFIIYAIKTGILSFLSTQVATYAQKLGHSLAPTLIDNPTSIVQVNVQKRSAALARLAQLSAIEQERKEIEATAQLITQQQKTIAAQRLCAKNAKEKKQCDDLEAQVLALIQQQNCRLAKLLAG